MFLLKINNEEMLGRYRSGGPLFFKENICCALTKDQCAANIFLKKQRATKGRRSPKQAEESQEKHKKEPDATQNVNKNGLLGIRMMLYWSQKH